MEWMYLVLGLLGLSIVAVIFVKLHLHRKLKDIDGVLDVEKRSDSVPRGKAQEADSGKKESEHTN